MSGISINTFNFFIFATSILSKVDASVKVLAWSYEEWEDIDSLPQYLGFVSHMDMWDLINFAYTMY